MRSKYHVQSCGSRPSMNVRLAHGWHGYGLYCALEQLLSDKMSGEMKGSELIDIAKDYPQTSISQLTDIVRSYGLFRVYDGADWTFWSHGIDGVG